MSTWMDLAFSPAVKGRADPPRLAAELCAAGGKRLGANGDRCRPCRVHRRAAVFLFGDREPGRPTLHPAPRRTARRLACARRQHARLRRLFRQPAIYLDRQSRRKPARDALSHGLPQSPPGEDLGPRARRPRTTPALIESLMPADYTARGEAAILFTVEAWDVNCPQHIPQMVFADDVAALEERIAALENENKRLREAAAGP